MERSPSTSGVGTIPRGSHAWKRLLAAAVAVLAVTAACGGGSSNESSNSQAGKGPVKGQIRLSWWGTGERNQRTMAVIDLFQKKYPGATVQGEPVGDFNTYWQKKTVEASAQNLPCVPQMQVRYVSQYTTRHVLRSLDDMVSSGAIDVSGIPKTVLDAGRGTDGKLYMVPTGTATNAWFFNSTMAEKAGVPQLNSNMSWDQVQSWLIDAKAKLPSGVYASDLRGGDDSLLVAWILSHGQQVFKNNKLGFSKQTMIDYWNWWEKLRRAGATVPASMMSEEPSDNQQGYITKGVVMLDERPPNQLGAIQAPMTANNRGTLKVLMYPKGPAGNGMALVNSGMSISSNCDNLPTAAAWVNFFTNDPQGAQAYSSNNGAVTVTKLLNTQIADPSLPSANREGLSFIKQIIANKAVPVNYPTGYNTMTDSLLRNYTNVAFGKMSVEKGVDTFFSETNNAIGG